MIVRGTRAGKVVVVRTIVVEVAVKDPSIRTIVPIATNHGKQNNVLPI
jgi:hypothetical protein